MGLLGMWRTIRPVEQAVQHMRVTPPAPAGRSPLLPADCVTEALPPGLRGASSGWSLYICYEDTQGQPSERRITCKRIERKFGGVTLVGAFCHERQSYRAFRIDRMREVIDLSTGEIVDPIGHFEMLHLTGLPVTDRGIATFARMLVFIAQCDGHEHEAERREIEAALTSYTVRFGGSDETLAAAIRTARGLSPDGRDLTNGLAALIRSPQGIRRQVARLMIDSCARIIDADRRLAEEEIRWGTEVGDALKLLATA